MLFEYRIKTWPHRLTHDINKPVLNLFFRFQFFIRKLDKPLCTSVIVKIKNYPIDILKNVFGYYNRIKEGVRYVNKIVIRGPAGPFWSVRKIIVRVVGPLKTPSVSRALSSVKGSGGRAKPSGSSWILADFTTYRAHSILDIMWWIFGFWPFSSSCSPWHILIFNPIKIRMTT